MKAIHFASWGPFRWLHTVWAVLTLAVCIALVSLGGGHPPPMVFVPHALLAGVIGHGVLLAAQGLASFGRRRALRAGRPNRRWPIELVAITILLGGFGLFWTVFAVGNASMMFTRPLEWLALAGIAAVHLLAFTTLMLRLSWARYVVAAASAGWAIALALQLGEARRAELPIALLLIAALIGVAAYVVRSARVRSALE